MTVEFECDTEAQAELLLKHYVESEGYFDFDGNNCADAWDEGEDCLGWDGESRRCFCGNRRVSWIMSKPSEGKWRYYAEAY